MYKGKRTCKILKEIRAQIAAENDIAFVTSECKHQGDCAGTCPKCEAEVRYLEKELEKRIRLGKAVTVAGLAAAITATSISATSCDAFRPTGGEPADAYVDITDGRNVKLSTFTPNYVANLPKAARTLQLQEVMEIKDTKNSDRWRILTFWEDYFVCFEDDTDYFLLYHPNDVDVAATRKGRLLVVTYTDDGAVAEVTVTKTEHQAQPLTSPDLLPTYCADTVLKSTFAATGYPASPPRTVLQEWWADCYLGAHEWLKNIDMFRMADGSLFWVYYDDQDKFSFSEYGAVEDYSGYGSWLMRKITPKTIANERKNRDVITWLNSSFENPRQSFTSRWYSIYSGGDYFIRASSASRQYYSLSTISKKMRNEDAKVSAIAIDFDENGKVTAIGDVSSINVSFKHAPLLLMDEYFAIFGRFSEDTCAALELTMQHSPLAAEEFSRQFIELWQPYQQSCTTDRPEMSDGEITAYHYMAISDGRSCELWAVTDPETGVIKGFASQDPFFLHPTGGDPPLSDPDPWDVTPYDE